MASTKNLKEKIMDYCLDEGILGKKVPDNPNIEFGFELNFPPNSPRPIKIMLIKPKDKKQILVQIATQVAPKQIEALNKSSPKGLMKFFYNVKKYLLYRNLSFNVDINNARYIISDIIYPDGLTEHEFYKTLRSILNSSLYINIILQETIAGKGGDVLKKDFNDFDITLGGSMYS